MHCGDASAKSSGAEAVAGMRKSQDHIDEVSKYLKQ